MEENEEIKVNVTAKDILVRINHLNYHNKNGEFDELINSLKKILINVHFEYEPKAISINEEDFNSLLSYEQDTQITR